MITLKPMGFSEVLGVARLRRVLHDLAPGKEVTSVYRFIMSACFVLSCNGALREIIYRIHPWFSFITVVAKDKKKVVGVAWLQRTGNKGIMLGGIIVEPSYHRNGVGTMLDKEREKQARVYGAKRIDLFIDAGNYKNLGLAKKRGYTPMRIYLGKQL